MIEAYEVAGLLMGVLCIVIGGPLLVGRIIVKRRERRLLSLSNVDGASFWADSLNDRLTRQLNDQPASYEQLAALAHTDTAVIPKVGGPNDETTLIPTLGRVTTYDPRRAAEADWFFQQDPLGSASLPEHLEPDAIGLDVFIKLAEAKIVSGGTLSLQVNASWTPWGYEQQR